MSKLNEEELIKLIEEALELKSKSVNIQSSSEDFEEWDSLGHLNILVSLDNKCDGDAAEIAELATASSIKDLVDILRANSLLD